MTDISHREILDFGLGNQKSMEGEAVLSHRAMARILKQRGDAEFAERFEAYLARSI